MTKYSAKFFNTAMQNYGKIVRISSVYMKSTHGYILTCQN